MQANHEPITVGSTWVSKKSGYHVEIVSVKDGAVWWQNDSVGFRGAQQTAEVFFRDTMRPIEDEGGKANGLR